MIFNVRQCCVVFFGGLQWRVRCGVGQVKEEGLIAIGLNGFFGFVRQVIGDETFGLEKFAVVKAHAETTSSPLKSVDDVKRLLRVHHIGIVLWQVKRAGMRKRQRLIKAMLVSSKLRCIAQMPLAHVQGSIALPL